VIDAWLSGIAGHLLKQRQPLLASFKLTRRCNLCCVSCPFWRQPTPDPDYDSVVDTLDQLQRTGARLLILEGGEPFLWRDGEWGLEAVVTAAQERFAFVGVVTNGTLGLDSSADVLWVSLDGLGDSHDQNRGPTFDRILANIAASGHPKLYVNM